MSDDAGPETRETPIDGAVVRRVADETAVDPDELAAALVELDAALLGRHSTFERNGDYVTVEGVRAYRVDEGDREATLTEFSFDDDVATAVRTAHTEQARLLYASATDADEGFGDDDVGVVVGVDTAEEF